MPTPARTVPPIPLSGAAWPASDILAGVRTRRIMAACVDFLLLSLVCVFLVPFALTILAVPLGVLFFAGTFALSWFVLPSFYPLLAFFYNGYAESSRLMGTPGMRMMGLEVRHAGGGRAPFLNAAMHGLFFYLSWMFPPVFLVSLVTPDKTCLHDLLAQVRVMRRLR
jgi:uncharacterized RDD family membrane protein YckC